ncbi:MAG: TetR/AcrR family transcriptional regulator [bacterium]|nr:TetR/AcrR family transcriptional regulator [bacterium]
MDLRIEKTRRGILNAFLALRSQKPLEKITVRELAAAAQINKSTFYAHYQDIFALSDSIEEELVESIIQNLSDPSSILTHPATFTRELALACIAQENLIRTIFSGNQAAHLPLRLELGIKKLVFAAYPNHQEDTTFQTFLSFCIYGAYYAFRQNYSTDLEAVLHTLGLLSEGAKDTFLASFASSQLVKDSK